MSHSIIGPSEKSIIDPTVIESFFPRKLNGEKACWRWREKQPRES